MGPTWPRGCGATGLVSELSPPDIYAALEPVIAVFNKIGIPYHIGGSVASSALGVARTTIDVDLVAHIGHQHIEALIQGLEEAYYIDRDMIYDAIERRASFNLIHFSTMLKVDVFIPKESPYANEAFSRKRLDRLVEESEEEFYIASAEDIVLNKLDWYRAGGEVSERQWGDLIGVLKVQGAALDMEYLHRWAGELDLMPLLHRALEEAGLSQSS